MPEPTAQNHPAGPPSSAVEPPAAPDPASGMGAAVPSRETAAEGLCRCGLLLPCPRHTIPTTEVDRVLIERFGDGPLREVLVTATPDQRTSGGDLP